MCVLAQPFAVGNIEAQVVSLIGCWVFVLMKQDDEFDGPLDGHCEVCVSNKHHTQMCSFNRNTGARRKDHSFKTIQYDLLWGHFNVRASRLIGYYSYSAEIRPLFFMTADWGGSTDQSTIHSHT